MDSSVVALLINKAIKKKLYCIMVDTGLMRKDEFEDTFKIFKNKYNLNIKLIKASKIFVKKLKNISNPEKKENCKEIYLLRYLKRSKKSRMLNFLHKELCQILLKVNPSLEANLQK